MRVLLRRQEGQRERRQYDDRNRVQAMCFEDGARGGQPRNEAISRSWETQGN